MEKNLIKKIQEAGIENCLFLVPMRPTITYFGFISLTRSSDPKIIVPAKIDETRNKLEDNYKITLKSVYNEFGTEHYYVSDLESLIRQKIVEFFIRG